MVLKISDHGLFETSNTNSTTITCWSGCNSEGTRSFKFYLFLTFQKKFLFRLTLCLTTKTKKKKKNSIEQSTAGPKISNVCTMDSSFFRSVEHWINHIAFPGYWGDLSYRKLITQTRFFESTPYPQLSSYFRWKWVWCFHFLLLEKCWHFCIMSSFSYFSWSVFDRRLYLVLSKLLWLL